MREEEINEIMNSEKEVRVDYAKQLVETRYYERKEKYVKDFLDFMQDLLRKFMDVQKQNVDRKLKYIYIKSLRTSVVDESYRYNVCLMDENGYMDTCAIDGYYTPLYLKNIIDEDKIYFEKEIMKKIIRAKKYEVKDFLKPYIWDTYIKLIPREIEEVISKIDDISIYNDIVRSDEVIVSYGEVLEKYDKYWIFTG